MIIQDNNTRDLFWNVQGLEPKSLSCYLQDLSNNDIVFSGLYPADIEHSGVIEDPGYYTTYAFSWERFSLDPSGNSIVSESNTESITTDPYWSTTEEFYPMISGVNVTINIYNSNGANSSCLIRSNGVQIYSGINDQDKHTVFIPSSSRGQQYNIYYLASISGQEVDGQFQVFSLPDGRSLNASYYDLFIKAASLNYQGISGMEAIFLGALQLLNTTPASVFNPNSEEFSPEQIVALQTVAIKLLTRHPQPEEFIRRFGLWAKYQNLDFESPGTITISANQKIAFIMMALSVCYAILEQYYNLSFKTLIDEMNSYRAIQYKNMLDPSGNWSNFFGEIYQTISQSQLELLPMYDYTEAVTNANSG